MEKVFRLKLSKVYSLLVEKALKKNRTIEEVNELIYWLLGYDENILKEILNMDVDYEYFFKNAPSLNPNRNQINGTICKVKISEIKDPIYQDMRRLDKMVDDLAKGKSLDKILVKCR